MGRRSINTTKSGKYMNPTDQASNNKTQTFHIFNEINMNSNFRKGSSQEGAQEEQETATNGTTGRAEKQRSLAAD